MKILSSINNCLIKVLLKQQYCVLCSSLNEQQICRECYNIICNSAQNFERNNCPRCLIERQPKQLECDNCKENQFVFTRIVAAFDYGFPLEKVLHQLKYSGKLEYSTLLSQLFWSQISKKITKLPDAIIPVPLHPKKHKLRGFNQTHELIREFTMLNPKVEVIYAQREKETQAQASLSRLGRIANISNAFSIKANLRGKNIVIIDDVVTTGSTVNEIAKLCKKLGAQDVQVWCLLRAKH